MITDYIAVLNNDATLRALLSASVAYPKIYAMRAPDGETSPWVVYGRSSEGSTEDVLDLATVSISVYAEDYETAEIIVRRIIVLLDLYEGGRNISSTDYRFLYSKLAGGGTETQEDDTRLYHLAKTFLVRYKRRSGG